MTVFFCHLSAAAEGLTFLYVFWNEGMRIPLSSRPAHKLLACCFFEAGFLCVDQADLKLRDPPASASCALGLKACTITTQPEKKHGPEPFILT